MSLRPDSYEERLKRARERDQWRRESARRYEQKKRDEGKKYSDMERSRLNPVNSEKKEKRYERDFGDKADWIRGMCCVVCGHSPVDPHHEPPRSLGGTKKDLVPLCPGHHTLKDVSRHELGSAERFREVHGVDLVAEARRLQEAWEAR